jgi:adenosine deaminase
MNEIATFIEGLPKAELHVHIEGTLEPEMMFEMAARNGVRLPYASTRELRAAYRFRNLQDFLDLYYSGVRVLRSHRDYYELTQAYLKAARANNVLHAEIFFDPQAHTSRGVPFEAVVEGIDEALRRHGPELGISSRLILCFLRDRNAREAEETLTQALPYRDRIVAVGLDSSERGHPPVKFRDVFDRARKEGLLAVAHAGEEGPPEYVRQALDVLGVRRIDHGIRVLEDERLVQRLAAEKVPLTVCPLSEVRLRVVADIEHHPLREMMERGLTVTVNSDDPAYFGGYIDENYDAVAQSHSLTMDEITILARNSFEASFLSREERDRLLAKVAGYRRFFSEGGMRAPITSR